MNIVLLVIGTSVVLLGVMFLWISVFDGENGERYRKQRMQGPFVPVHPDADHELTEIRQK